jgi:hypothetical protein
MKLRRGATFLFWGLRIHAYGLPRPWLHRRYSGMSRCRSKSFYLAPGLLRYFKDHTLATWNPETGALVRFLHRNDIAAFQRRFPTWDGVCIAPGCSRSASSYTSPAISLLGRFPRNSALAIVFWSRMLWPFF